MLTTSALRDYVYLVCISVTVDFNFCSPSAIRSLLLLTTGESPVVTDDCHLDLSGLQSTIKISLIIAAAVRNDPTSSYVIWHTSWDSSLCKQM